MSGADQCVLQRQSYLWALHSDCHTEAVLLLTIVQWLLQESRGSDVVRYRGEGRIGGSISAHMWPLQRDRDDYKWRCRQKKKRHDILFSMFSYNILNTSEMTCFSCGRFAKNTSCILCESLCLEIFLFYNLLIRCRGGRCLSTIDNYKIKKQY